MSSATSPALRVFVDTDGGVDDIVALSYLLACRLADVVGISTVAGNVSLGQALSNVLDLLSVNDRMESPLAPGCAESLRGASLRRGPSRHADRDDDPTVVGGKAIDEWLDPGEAIGEAAPGGAFDLLALGPLTNVAGMVDHEPWRRLFERIVWLGGDGPDLGSEFNAGADPDAVEAVMRSGIPVVRVPLAITCQVSDDLPDAVAAVALTRPDLFDIDPETHVVRGVDVDEVASELRRGLAASPLLRRRGLG